MSYVDVLVFYTSVENARPVMAEHSQKPLKIILIVTFVK